jgi:hypothetical protein
MLTDNRRVKTPEKIFGNTALEAEQLEQWATIGVIRYDYGRGCWLPGDQASDGDDARYLAIEEIVRRTNRANITPMGLADRMRAIRARAARR